ncbi:hypothetical protein [Kribbella sp.]|uniref:hypothetical protein n=1 Tax=Kribbella sp. TaxID=1871183 RepID=UPI002D5E3B2F|nr:hypothetical protein [Kribbella sp.]HZX09192.1 hypothetical protein [Kribbella sp.]
MLLVLVWLIVQLGWIGVVLSLLISVTSLFVFRRASPVPAEEAVEPPFSQLSTSGLPTADETVFLDLSATVHWQAAKAESYHADVARAFVLECARQVTSRWSPGQYSLAQHELAAGIGRPRIEPTAELEVWATDVRLVLPEAVRQHLAKLDEAHRDGLLWEVSALNESRVRTYLRDDALRTPASTIVWWLANNQWSVEQAVGLAEVLTRLSHLATGNNEPDAVPAVEPLVNALDDLDDAARRPAANDLAVTLDQSGLPDLAKSVRDRYNLPKLHSVGEEPGSFGS